MVYAELIDLIQKKDTGARKHWFDTFFGRFSAIALRYSKSVEQANSMMHPAMHNCYEKVQNAGPGQEPSEASILKMFTTECVNYIRNIRSEYYVSSTVYATAPTQSKTYNLFEINESPDLNAANTDVLLAALQQLVPAQRLIFNLHVIDGFSLADAADLLEASEPTVKSNLEKARFNLQKNIENSIKTAKT
jgi:RNA polymerase sigma-70 factor (ECF subfamily)